MRVTKHRYGGLAALTLICTVGMALAGCSSASVGSVSQSTTSTSGSSSGGAGDSAQSINTNTNVTDFSSIIPKGNVVAASKKIIAQNQSDSSGAFTPPDIGAKAQRPGAVIDYVAADTSDGGIMGAAKGVEQAAKVIGWKVQVFDGQATVSGHTNAMDQAIATHPAAIILGGMDATEQKSTVAAATQAGIPVFGWHAAAEPGPGSGMLLNVTSNPLRVAQLAAALAVAKSNGHVGAVIMEDSTYAIAVDKAEAMAAYIKACKTCQMLQLVNSPIAAVAQDMPGVISASLQKFGPKFNYLLAINGNYFSGAAPALKSAGKSPAGPPYGIAAGDGVASEFARIRDSQYQYATVAEPLYLQGWQLVDAINDHFAHHAIPDFVADPGLITKANVPSGSIFDPSSNYAEIYKKIWGK